MKTRQPAVDFRSREILTTPLFLLRRSILLVMGFRLTLAFFYLFQLRANYKLVAKAMGRIGTAYLKKTLDLYYQKLLSNQLREVEHLKVDEDHKAYVALAREEGNVRFKVEDFAGAVKDHTKRKVSNAILQTQEGTTTVQTASLRK